MTGVMLLKVPRNFLFTGCSLGKLIEYTVGVAASDVVAEEDVLKKMVDVDVLIRAKAPRSK